MRETASRLRCGRKWVTTKVRSSRGKPVARRRAHTMARSSSVAFQGSFLGRLERSWQSAAPRLRHLRMVSVETPYRRASTPVGSVERAISARTAGVVRALGWIVGIRTSSADRDWAERNWAERNWAERAWHNGQSARRTPQSPNEPDPSNVPLPNSFCNGPCCVKSLSDRHVAEFLLLFVVSAGLPHHAIREETASPSRTRDRVRRPLTTLRTASPLPSSRRRDLRGAGPISPCSKLLLLPPGSTPPRSPGPSERSCHPPTCGGERPQACAPAPPSLASCRAAWPPPAPNA